MTKRNPIFTAFDQRCGFSPSHRNTCTLQPVLSSGGAGLPSNPSGLQTWGLFSRCHFYTSPPETQCCTCKLLSREFCTVQLQERMCFARLSYSFVPPRASEDLQPISSIPNPGNAAGKGKSRDLPTRSDTHRLCQAPSSHFPCPCREVMSNHSDNGIFSKQARRVPFLWGQVPGAPSSSWTSPASWCGAFTYFKSWNQQTGRDHTRTLQHSQKHSQYLPDPQSCTLAVTKQFSLLLAMGTTQISLTFPDWHLHSLALSDQADHLAGAGCIWVNWKRQPGEDSQVLKRRIQCEAEIQTAALSGRAVFSGWS